jgi:CheY-like chemotaxis protein
MGRFVIGLKAYFEIGHWPRMRGREAMDSGLERQVIAVVRDLFFSIRIKETLQAHGYTVAVANSPQALMAALADAPTALIVLDLNFRGIDPPATIAQLKADPASKTIPILAFGSHLDHAARDAAKAAGADRVVPNSKLAEDLPALAARYATPGYAPSDGDEDGADDEGR